MRILLFTGKGGVGKTTVAAATAARAAEFGLRTIVCSTDPAHSLADAFDVPLGDRPTPIAHGLFGQQLNARVRFEEAWDDVRTYLVDVLVMIPAYVVIFIGIAIGASGATTDPVTGEVSGGNAAGFVLASVGYLLIFGILIWNTIFRQGRTGWSVGKQVLGIRLLKEQTGEPMGAGLCFVRQVVHIVDGLPCYLGYLWPLWDAKRQTFADKIMTTVVVQQKKG